MNLSTSHQTQHEHHGSNVARTNVTLMPCAWMRALVIANVFLAIAGMVFTSANSVSSLSVSTINIT